MKDQPKNFTHKEIKPLVKKSHLKLKLLIGLVVIIWTSIGAYGIYDFVNTHDFRTPIIIQNPITSKLKDVIISPVATGSAKTSMVDVSAIADKIYTLESSRGKHVLCPEGTYNGYGFRQNSSEWICYSSHDEVRMKVIAWLAETLSTHSLQESLCIYNKGINETGCTYSMNYLSLK